MRTYPPPYSCASGGPYSEPMPFATYDQAEAKRQKAVRFLRDVVGDDERAEKFDGMDTETYAVHKGLTLINPSPKRSHTMTKLQLEKEVRALRAENEELAEQLDSIAAIVAPDDEDDDEDFDEDDDEEEDEDDEGK